MEKTKPKKKTHSKVKKGIHELICEELDKMCKPINLKVA